MEFTINSLPNDTLLLILTYTCVQDIRISKQSLYECLMVSKKWYYLLTSDQSKLFWDKVFRELSEDSNLSTRHLNLVGCSALLYLKQIQTLQIVEHNSNCRLINWAGYLGTIDKTTNDYIFTNPVTRHQFTFPFNLNFTSTKLATNNNRLVYQLGISRFLIWDINKLHNPLEFYKPQIIEIALRDDEEKIHNFHIRHDILLYNVKIKISLLVTPFRQYIHDLSNGQTKTTMTFRAPDINRFRQLTRNFLIEGILNRFEKEELVSITDLKTKETKTVSFPPTEVMNVYQSLKEKEKNANFVIEAHYSNNQDYCLFVIIKMINEYSSDKIWLSVYNLKTASIIWKSTHDCNRGFHIIDFFGTDIENSGSNYFITMDDRCIYFIYTIDTGILVTSGQLNLSHFDNIVIVDNKIYHSGFVNFYDNPDKNILLVQIRPKLKKHIIAKKITTASFNGYCDLIHGFLFQGDKGTCVVDCVIEDLSNVNKRRRLTKEEETIAKKLGFKVK